MTGTRAETPETVDDAPETAQGTAQEAAPALSSAKRALLAQRLRRRTTVSAVTPRPAGVVPPLSHAQERLWFLEQYLPGTAAYVVPLSVRVTRPIDGGALTEALRGVVARHESLRMRFVTTDDGRPEVVVDPEPAFGLRVVEAEGADAAGREAWARQAVQDEIARPFDLAAGPLIRVLAVRLGDADHVLAITAHHTVVDGWSCEILLRELLTLHDAHLSGAPVALPELPVQYGDYAVWHRERATGPAYERDVAYWRETLAGVEPLELPGDRPRPAEQDVAGAGLAVDLDADLSRAVAALAASEGATTYMVLLAAFQALLHRYSGQTDFAVGSPVSGRAFPELENLVGLFVNTLPMRARLAGDPSFAELLGRTRDGALDAYAHQELPFDQLVNELGVERDVSRSPVFQVLFSLQNYDGRRDPSVSGFPFATSVTRFDLALYLTETPDGLRGAFVYRTALFLPETVGRMAGHLERLLRAAVADPAAPVSRLRLLSPEEEREALALAVPPAAAPDADGAGAAPPPALLHDVLAVQAAARPGDVAVVCGDRSMTYGELDAASAALAGRLRDLGVRPDDRVAVCLEQSAELAQAVLGVLRAGAAYLPLDPEQPEERLAYMVADAGARVVVTTPDLAAGLPFTRDLTVVGPGEEGGRTYGDPGVRPENLAYVIYTSGTTGRPKGVAVQHREVVTYLTGVRERFAVPDGGTFALLQSLAFDFGVTIFYLSLMTGGRLRLVPSRTSAPDLASLLRDVDVLKITPSHLAALLAESDPRALLPRRLLLLGGEASGWEWARDLAAIGGCAVANHYGPTEATVGVTTFAVDPVAPDEDVRGATLPIGRPLPGARVYVLDEALRPVPPGVPGEIHLGGDRLARGYLGRPGLTADRFLPDPYGEPGGRMYRTGDLARWLPSGELQFLGRRDLQVKIRGYRVELGEVEAVLADLPGVAQAAAVLRGDRLVAYLTGDVPADAELRSLLRERLPEYMIPARFVRLDRLPLKSHGKVDRAALPDPGAAAPFAEDYAEPGTDLERAVAEIWAEVLDVERVGALDDFFDSGGHSLLAMRVVARLRKLVPDRPVTVMDLFRHRTVRELAQLLEAGEPVGGAFLLHRLTPARAVTSGTVVCAPYGGGNALIYKPLADVLPDDWALYSIAVPGHELGEEAIPLEELAERCVGEILENVRGPLVLYGHCGLGVMISAEIARRLEAAGREVDAVYLGGIFPFARPRGGMARLADWMDRLRGDQAMVNALTAAGLDADEFDPEQLKLIVRNRREGTKQAERYFTRLYEERAERLNAPVIAVAGERDPATEFYQERYREWHRITDVAAAAVLDEAGHFFMKYRAEELARIVTELHPAIRSGDTGRFERREDATWWLQGVSRLGLAEGPASQAVSRPEPDGASESGAAGPEAVPQAGPDRVPESGSGSAPDTPPGPDRPEPGDGDHTASGERARDALGSLDPATSAGRDRTAPGERDHAVPGGLDGAGLGGPRPSMRRFLLVAAGQLVSITGSALTEFAVPVWIYLTTGSLANFALFAVIGLVPGMLVSPLAGAIVDRYDRRRVMLAGDGAAGLTQLALGVLLWTGNLQVWHIYPLLACLSVALTFQRLAYGSAVPQLVPKRYLGHANGVVQMAFGVAQLAVPLVAVGLMAAIGLQGILAFDVASYTVAFLSVLLVRFPAAMAWRRRETVLDEIKGGFRLVWGRRPFRGMLVYFAVLNVFLSPLFLMLSPLVLAQATLADVGRVAFAGGAGVFLGGLAMTVWGGPRRRRLRGVLVSTLVLALFCLVTGLRANLALVAFGSFGMSLGLTLLNGVYATIIQVKVPQRFHGRVIALNTLIAWSTLPIGFGLVAPYGAAVLEPLLARGGPLAGTVGLVIGTGPGRGIGFLYVCLALGMAATALVAMRVPVLARFDDEMPDALPDDLVGVETLRARTPVAAAAVPAPEKETA
ncbi:hypothetical protein GCM10009530_57220 [Microbispora corallina]|uniref:Carrier domain-containing protein n=1 Tax=Microbispora corallina TaxID=83302 RepID=A0ABQ4G3L2_9ACTN|nr:non-ribosomal peptide synthetase/MFS transporter [Microbispora corallina]GIH41667.1 hypothetical protein Mco01_46670 [Microbispora corallina]